MSVPPPRRLPSSRRSDSDRLPAPPPRAAVVRVVWGRNLTLAGLLPLPEGEPRAYGPSELQALRRDLSALDLVIGLQPQVLFERLDLDPGACRLVDLSLSGGQAPARPRAGLKMLTGRTLHPDRLLAREGRDPAGSTFQSLLLQDLQVLRAYYRFGVLHGWVPRRRERVAVHWRAEAEPSLQQLLEQAIEAGLATDLVVTSPERPGSPFHAFWRVVPEEAYDGILDYRHPERLQIGRLPLESILDARLAPLPPGAVTFPPEARRNHRARRLVSRAWEASQPETRDRLVERALEVDPECLDALVMKALDLPQVARRLEALEQAVQVGRRQVEPFLEERLGEFWQVLETRPFLRVCHALMFEYHSAGRLDEALGMARNLLILNRRDELGARYPYWSWLLEAGRDWEALRSLRDFAEERTAMYLYARALAEFRVRGAREARLWARQALEANVPFAEFLRDPEALPGWDVDSFSPGSTEEALALWRLFGPSWRAGGAVAVELLR